MVRNLSLKADDNFDDRLYSISKRKGMTKSSYIRMKLEEAVNRDMSNSNIENDTDFHQLRKYKPQENILDDLIGSSNADMVKNDQEKKGFSSLQDNKDLKNMQNIRDNTSEIKNKPEEQKEISKDTPLLNNNITSRIKTENVEENSLGELGKDKSVSNKQDQKINDQQVTKRKFKIGKVKRVNDEIMGTGITEGDVERRINEVLDKKKFNQSIDEMHKKIDGVCSDGKCLKDEMTEIKKSLGKLDTVCEDGKCLKEQVGNLKKDFGDELKDLKKHFENLDSKISKKEPCPKCNAGIEEMSSYCPNCGLPITEWFDEKGSKIDWKPFKDRNKQ